jgi:hypothetical protein
VFKEDYSVFRIGQITDSINRQLLLDMNFLLENKHGIVGDASG